MLSRRLRLRSLPVSSSMLNNEPFDRTLRCWTDSDRRLCESSPFGFKFSSEPFVFFAIQSSLLLLLIPFDVGCKLIGIGLAGDGLKWPDASSPLGGEILMELSGLCIWRTGVLRSLCIGGNSIGGNGGTDAAAAATAAACAALFGNSRCKPYGLKLGGKNGFAPGYMRNGGVAIACDSCGTGEPNNDWPGCGRDVGDVGRIGVEPSDGGPLLCDAIVGLQNLMCFAREFVVLKFWPQCSHLNCVRQLDCNRLWRHKLENCVYALWQFSHWNGLTDEWICSCCLRPDSLANVFPQSIHG